MRWKEEKRFKAREVTDWPLMTVGKGKEYGWPLEATNSSQIDNQQESGNLGTPTAKN